ncbi:MAG: excinuclease ABC subunit UvrC [Candidatus Woesearchaeota archaeon]
MKIKLSNIPKEPGIYMFKDDNKKVIYVGKAKNLRQRVSSYYNKNNNAKALFLTRHIRDVDFIIMPSEKDALILENRMIKKHNPKYNIRLKDSKTYSYIAITKEEYPRLISTRRIPKDTEWFGPYTEALKKKETLLLAQKIYNIRTCKRMPKKACLNYHIGLCSAPCINAITKEEYNNSVVKALKFLRGDIKETQKKISEEMHYYSSMQKYEIALKKKRQLESIMILSEKQNVEHNIGDDWDIWAIMRDKNTILISILTVRKGIISGKKNYNIDDNNDNARQFLTQYYTTNRVPKEIIVSEELWEDNDEKDAIIEYLKTIKKQSVRILLPLRGEKKRLLDIALKNAMESTNINNASLEMQKMLNLAYPPRIIECFDMSNLQGTGIVGGMTRWINMAPNKNGYRRFEIRETKNKPDDYSAMKETVYRRYKRLKEESSQYPDLIIVDGGIGQLNASINALSSLGIQIPIIGIAKKNEEIYIPNTKEPIRSNPNKEPLLSIRRIRDATHNYVLSYHRHKRRMNFRKETGKQT